MPREDLPVRNDLSPPALDLPGRRAPGLPRDRRGLRRPGDPAPRGRVGGGGGDPARALPQGGRGRLPRRSLRAALGRQRPRLPRHLRALRGAREGRLRGNGGRPARARGVRPLDPGRPGQRRAQGDLARPRDPRRADRRDRRLGAGRWLRRRLARDARAPRGRGVRDLGPEDLHHERDARRLRDARRAHGGRRRPRHLARPLSHGDPGLLGRAPARQARRARLGHGRALLRRVPHPGLEPDRRGGARHALHARPLRGRAARDRRLRGRHHGAADRARPRLRGAARGLRHDAPRLPDLAPPLRRDGDPARGARAHLPGRAPALRRRSGRGAGTSEIMREIIARSLVASREVR